MRKKVAKWLIGILVGSITVLSYLLFFYTHIFSPFIISYINDFSLAESNIRISGSLHGNLIGRHTGMDDLTVTLNNGSDTLFAADRLTLTGWAIDLETFHLETDQLGIENYRLNSSHIEELQSTTGGGGKPFSISVNNFSASSGVIETAMNDSILVVHLDDFYGNLWLIDGHLGADISVYVPDAPIPGMDTVRISGLLSRSKGGSLQFEDLAIYDEESYLELKGSLDGGQLSTQFRSHQFEFTRLKEVIHIPKSLEDGVADMDLHVVQNVTSGATSISGTGNVYLGDNEYPITITKANYADDNVDVDMQIGSEFNYSQLYANYSVGGNIDGELNLFRPDLNTLVNNEKLRIDDPIGKITFSGRSDELHIQADIDNFTLNDVNFSSLRATLDYEPQAGVTVSEGALAQGENTIDFEGLISEDSLNLGGALNVKDLSFLQSFTSNNLLNGSFISLFNIEGDLETPRIRGDLFPENLGLNNKMQVNGTAKYDLIINNGQLEGDIALHGQEGLLMGDSLISYDLLTNFSDRKFEIEELHVQGKTNLISMSGLVDRQSAALHKLNVILGEDQLRLIDSVKISRSSDSTYHIPSTLVTFNLAGISLEGDYHQDRGLNISTQYEMVNFGDFMRFAKVPITFSGTATGQATISGSMSDPVFRTQFTMLDGNSIGYPSDTATVDITIRSNATISHRLDASRAGGNLTLIGQLPWGYRLNKEELRESSQNFSIQFENYRLRDIKLNTVVGMPVSGRATGSVTFRGTPIRTKMDADLQIAEGKFDTLEFNRIYADFVYEDNLWTFDSLSTISNWGYGSGIGSMPISLDMIADDRNSVFDRDIGMDFEFVLNQMPFLSSYIGALDVIEGDIQANLSFSGPIRSPIRNGKVRAHNGTVRISILGNPITDVHSELTLVDNTMTIDHFSGRMQFTEGSALNIQGVVGRATSLIGDLIGIDAATTYAGEVSASGEIDFSSFFHPKFDVNLDANEVYYRSADGLIEAIADASLHLTGQDTMDVTAVIPVKRAVYYDNFGSGAAYYEEIGGIDSSLFRYSLQTEFASDLLISNDQLEAEFEGELWLLDYGDGQMHFSGTLNALQGGKFYYLGNELDIVSGEIIFQSVEFNPQINIEAQIDIDSDLITLQLTGDLLEPELVIDPGTSQLSQSDIFTYLTINQTLVEVSFEDGSALNPVESYSEMLVEKQISKIGREITGLDILTISGVDISGDRIGFGSDTTDVPRFQVGQRLSKNLKVTYEGALQPTGGKTDYDFGLEYQINRKFSVTSKVNQDGEVELNGRLKFTY